MIRLNLSLILFNTHIHTHTYPTKKKEKGKRKFNSEGCENFHVIFGSGNKSIMNDNTLTKLS